VQVLISRINRLLEISNVVNDQTYIKAGILNFTNAPFSMRAECCGEHVAERAISGFGRDSHVGYDNILRLCRWLLRFRINMLTIPDSTFAPEWS
jgi:hypothetical protein